MRHFYTKKSVLIRLALISLMIGLVLSCSPMRFSPFSDQVETNLSNVNTANIARLQQNITAKSATDQSIKFALVADSHANYSDLEKVVATLNTQDIDFTVHLGDMTDLGMAVEYDAVASLMNRLNQPWLSVIGNHDAIGNGRHIYRKIFGPYNQSFELENFKFIIFNNNKLDFHKEGIELQALKNEIIQSTKPVVLFQHADPFNSDNFNQSDLALIQEIINEPNLVAVFHGHLHHFSRHFYGKTLVQQIHRTEDEAYGLVELNNNSITINLCKGGRCEESRSSFLPNNSL